MAKDKDTEARPADGDATVCSHCGAGIPAHGIRFVVPSRPDKAFCCYKCYLEDGIKTVQERVTND